MRTYILPFVFCLMSIAAFTQPQFGISLMDKTLQSSYLNPALGPEEKITISLPHIYNHLEVSGPSFGQLVTTNAAGDKVLDVDAVLPALNDVNQLRENFSIETLGIGFGAGPVRIHIHHAIKFGAFVEYPKALPQLLWQGNAQFVGQTIDLSNDFQINGYNEFGFGASFNIKGVSLGGRVKLLTGLGDASTENNNISLHTSDDVYQLTLDADYKINSSSYIEYNGFEDTRADFNFGSADLDNIFSKNTGLAFDFGVNVEIGKLNIGASILDLGRINWTEDPGNYTSKGTFVYEGLDFTGAITGDSINFSDALDTLDQIFMIEETQEKYSTTLPPKIYVHANFQLTENWLLAASFYNEVYREQSRTGISVGAQTSLLKWLRLGANYSIYGDTYANIGLNAVLKFGPVQIMALTDNVIALLAPDSANFGNARAGLNLVF
jgi:hypothetical protein